MSLEKGSFLPKKPLPAEAYKVVTDQGIERRFIDVQYLFERDREDIIDKIQNDTREAHLEAKWEKALRDATRAGQRLGIL